MENSKNKVKVYEPLELVKGSPQKIVPGYYPILYLLLSMMGERLKSGGDMDNLDYSFTVNNVGPEFQLRHSKNAYRKLAEMVHNVNENTVLFHVPIIDDRGKNALTEFPAYAGVTYSEDGVITITVSPRFNSIAVEWLKRKGFKVFFDRCEVLPMKSEYSMAIFPDLISNLSLMPFAGKGTLNEQKEALKFTSIYPVDKFREKLKIPDSYQTVGIKRICQQIVNDVEKFTRYKTTVYFNYTSGKQTAKRLTHICFMTKEKEAPAEIPVETKEKIIPDSVEQTVKPSKYDILWLEGLTDGVISGRTAEKVMSQAKKNGRSREYVEKCYKAGNKETTNNLVGMMISLIQNGLDEPIKGGHSGGRESNHDYLMRVIETGML